jgi:hypothetical protein
LIKNHYFFDNYSYSNSFSGSNLNFTTSQAITICFRSGSKQYSFRFEPIWQTSSVLPAEILLLPVRKNKLFLKNNFELNKMRLKINLPLKGILIFITIICIFHGGFGQVKGYHVTDGVNLTDKKGIFYSLPQTLIKVEITVLKKEYYAGPYADYAGKYLDLENVSTSDYSEYSITDVKLGTVSEPDPGQYYFAEIDDKSIKESTAMLFSLNEAGLISGLDANILKSTLKENITKISDKQDAYAGMFQYSAETNLYEKTDTIVTKVVVDTVTVTKKYLDRKWVEKSTEQKAVEAANMVSKIRENRFNLLTAYQEVPFDAGTIAYMDQKLESLENEYLSLFTGMTIEKTLHYSFTVLPEKSDEAQTIPVFVISERSGIKEPNSAGGEKISLKIDPAAFPSALVNINKDRDKSADQGFFYRIPVTSKVSIEISSDLKVQANFPIAQFGSVTFLPSAISSVQFYPETGSIKNIIIE